MNNILKQQVLNNGCYSCYVQWRKYRFLLSADSDFDKIELLDEVTSQLESYSQLEIDECRRLYNAKRSRSSRLKNRISSNFNLGFAYFVTLTFNDDCLSNTSASSRRQFVSRFLSSLDCMFWANLDYGGQFGREHYHAVVILNDSVNCDSKSPDYFFSGWNKRGFSSAYLIPDNDLDQDKISRYISKCSNHALKETALRSNLIYSRKKPTWYFSS